MTIKQHQIATKLTTEQLESLEDPGSVGMYPSFTRRVNNPFQYGCGDHVILTSADGDSFLAEIGDSDWESFTITIELH